MQADGEEANQAINRSADQGTTNVGKSPPEDELPYLVYLVTCLSYLLVVALAAIFIDDLTPAYYNHVISFDFNICSWSQ